MNLNQLQAYIDTVLKNDPAAGNYPVLVRDGNNGMTMEASSLFARIVKSDSEEGGPILDMLDGENYVELYAD